MKVKPDQVSYDVAVGAFSTSADMASMAITVTRHEQRGKRKYSRRVLYITLGVDSQGLPCELITSPFFPTMLDSRDVEYPMNSDTEAALVAEEG